MDWNFVLSIITIIIAVIALMQSSYQISISNKQFLFDRRLKSYNMIKDFMVLCESNEIIFKSYNNNIEYSNDMKFSFMTNNSYLQDCVNAIKNPLQRPYHQEFLTKQEEIKRIALEQEFLFKDEEAILCKDFILAYVDVLKVMYQYQILINNINDEKKKESQSIEKIQSLFGEEESRKEVKIALNNLQEVYKKVKTVDEKLRKQISLVKVG